MPIVQVTYGSKIGNDVVAELARALPRVVSLAVACPEEPYDHDLQPGDVDLRFRAHGPHDVGGLDVVVEVRSKWFASRAGNRQERCDQIRDAVLVLIGGVGVGVYLALPVAAWSQTA